MVPAEYSYLVRQYVLKGRSCLSWIACPALPLRQVGSCQERVRVVRAQYSQPVGEKPFERYRGARGIPGPTPPVRLFMSNNESAGMVRTQNAEIVGQQLLEHDASLERISSHTSRVGQVEGRGQSTWVVRA